MTHPLLVSALQMRLDSSRGGGGAGDHGSKVEGGGWFRVLCARFHLQALCGVGHFFDLHIPSFAAAPPGVSSALGRGDRGDDFSL